MSEDGIQIASFLEGEKPEEGNRVEKTKVRTPMDVKHLVKQIADADQECVMVLTLDGNNQVTTKLVITIGLVNQSQIHPREVFRWAIRYNASSIIIVHNHPSGNLEPSESDLIATRRLVECSKTIGIAITDHVIVGGDGLTSIRERYPSYFDSFSGNFNMKDTP